MRLTRRQEEFILKMIELKHEFASPVHYSVLAERLGVSPFTAYDMLCLLEEKGYVTSEYQLPAEKSGPGRAERLFYPSAMAQAEHQRFIEMTGGKTLGDEALKALAREKFSRGETPDPEMTEQLMRRLLPADQGELGYCVEVMTVAALRLRHTPEGQSLAEQLPHLLPAGDATCKSSLCLLGGFVYALLTQHCAASPEWLSKLRDQLHGYLERVIPMSDEECARLTGEISVAFAALDQVEA